MRNSLGYVSVSLPRSVQAQMAVLDFFFVLDVQSKNSTTYFEKVSLGVAKKKIPTAKIA